MDDPTVIIALNHQGYFWKHFVEFKVRIGKNYAFCPKHQCSKPQAQSYSMNNIFITDSYKKRKNAHARTHAHTRTK